MGSESGEDRMASPEANWSVVGVLGAARGATGGGDTIGTEHLLVAIADVRGDAGRALCVAGATVAAQLAVLRGRDEGSWLSADDREASLPSERVLGDDGDSGRLSGAAIRAFRFAMGRAREENAKKYTAEQLLRGLLDDAEGRAAEVLRICGSSPEEVLRALDGAPPEDGIDPLLRPTRDALLGRRARKPPFWKRLLLVFTKGVNLAAAPVTWVGLDCLEQSRGLGQEAGTEHVLLAVLATHEAGLRHPHMAAEGGADPEVRRAGGARLARMGVDYASVYRAVERADFDLGSDERDFDAFLDAAEGDEGTGPLVDALLRGDTRARRLLESLGFAVDRTGPPPSGPMSGPI
ncbi:Clp protease N-terminal domain-containing protein [Streptomyces sp. NPDC014894]|uniref:Clp protease N-terminal domain-containing protein n=1 Tax=Streptomyces sp. NPDC014894 TaxID=3364931 RepID=UPI0036FE4E21